MPGLLQQPSEHMSATNSKSVQRSSVFQAIGLFILLLTAQPALALTTLTVTVSTDNNPGGQEEVGDLRYALNSMNQGLNTVPDDYAIVFASPMTIQLNGILPLINNSANPVNITIGKYQPIFGGDPRWQQRSTRALFTLTQEQL